MNDKEKQEKSSYEKEQLQERLAKLAGGVAVIGVGAATEVEMKDKKLRIEDALSATRAAVEEGIVAGGGTAFINILPEVEKFVESLPQEEKLGGKIVTRALQEPVRQIAINAGLEPAVILEKVKASPAGVGFDAGKEEYVAQFVYNDVFYTINATMSEKEFKEFLKNLYFS